MEDLYGYDSEQEKNNQTEELADRVGFEVGDINANTSVRVPVEDKIRWFYYIQQNNEYDGLSHLIRSAVRKEIDNNYVFQEDESDFDPEDLEIDVDFSSIGSQMNIVLDKIEQVEADIKSIKDTSTPSTDEGDELYHLASRIEDILIKIESEEKFINELSPELNLPIAEQAAISGEIDKIAEALGEEDTVKVRKAADYLKKNNKNVKSVMHRGKRKFYKLK